jgi:hypothetical protein
MATILNAGTTTATGLNITTDISGAMAIQTSGVNAISISSSQVITLANALPANSGGTGITSLGTGVATWLGTPSSANLAAAVTDETGSGALVFGTSPTITSASLVTPALGTPASGVLTNCTGTANGLTAGAAKAIANTGGWAITPTGTKLYFSYNGTNVASMDSSGNFISLLTVAAGTTP